MKKHIIIASHSYSAYYNIIKPLVPHLIKNDFHITFVHLNNLSSKIKTVNDLYVTQIDFSTISTNDFLNYLNKKKPTHVFCLEFTSLFIISLIRILCTFNVKSIYFEHGIFIEGHGDKFLIKNLKESLYRYLKVSFIYCKYIIATKLSFFLELKFSYKAFFKRDYTGLFESGLFYSERGYKLVESKMKIPSSNIYYSGYPVTMFADDLNELKQIKESEKNEVLYIHQPLIADGISKINYVDEIKLLSQIDKVCREYDLILTIKLHPRADLDFYKSQSKHLNFTKDELFILLRKTKIIIGQFSTAIFNGYVLNIPVILYPYPDLYEMYYKTFLPYSYISKDENTFRNVLKKIKESKFENTNLNASEIIGGYNTFQKQAEIINIITKNK